MLVAPTGENNMRASKDADGTTAPSAQAPRRFELKSWLDQHVIPLTRIEPPLSIYSFLWNGNPPTEVLVWLRAGSVDDDEEELGDLVHRENTGHAPPPFDGSLWPSALRALLTEHGFRFDFLREEIAVALEGSMIKLFGSDGAPLYNKLGMASARLFKKMPDGVGLILQVGCQYPDGLQAAAATKQFYQSFDESPLELTKKFGTVFGQA